MASTDQKVLSREEQLADLTVKYEAVEHELNTIKLENMEYTKDIEELKERNSQLIEQIASYQELLGFEQQQIEFNHALSITLDDLNVDNTDLNIKIKEYKKLLKQLKSENISLRNENKKYKIALENYDESKQKREEIYINNKLNLENRIKEQNLEIESLQKDILTINAFSIVSRPNMNKNDLDSDEQKQYEPTTPYKDDIYNKIPTTPFGILRLRSNETPRPTFADFRSASMTTTPRTDFIDHLLEHPKIEATPAFSDFGIDEEDGNVDVGYSMYNKYDKCHNNEYSKKSMGSSDDNHDNVSSIAIKQSITNEFDIELLTAKIDEIHKLKQINNDHETEIKRLEDEIKLLKQQNHQLIERLDTDFRCIALKWFS